MSEFFRKYIKKEHFPVQPTYIKFKTNFKNCVLDTMKRRQWREVENDEWDIIWIDKEWVPDVFDHQHISSFQKINHFRNHFELTRKDLMIKNFKKHKKNLEKEGKIEESQLYNYLPMTYNVPSEYSIFCEEFKRINLMNDSKQIWIMKPASRAQGKGIFLFKNLKDIINWKNNYRLSQDNSSQVEPYVVQKYISDPLLIGGKKFDLRIYALCVSYQPLTIYLYRSGFARFTHNRYDNDDIVNTFIHITNVAIQKTSENYDEKLGGKWILHTLKLFLIAKFGQEKVSECFYQIQNMIIKSLQTVQKLILNDKRCFELYGFDILLDANLKPWVLEINASASMTSNTQLDYELKVGLLDDVFSIIDLEKILTGQEEQIGGFDLIYKGQPIKLPTNSTYSSLLGCYNNRIQQLKKLAKSTAIRLAQNYTEKYNQNKEQRQRSVSKGNNQQNNSSTVTSQSSSNTINLQQQQQQIQNQKQNNKFNSEIQRSAYTKQQPQFQNKLNQQLQQKQNQNLQQRKIQSTGGNGIQQQKQYQQSKNQQTILNMSKNQQEQSQLHQQQEEISQNHSQVQDNSNNTDKQFNFERYILEDNRYNQIIQREKKQEEQNQSQKDEEE